MRYLWSSGGAEHALELAFVEGTRGNPYAFGEEGRARFVEVGDFFMATAPVTQALWAQLMGAGNDPSLNRGEHKPVENVSWDQLHQPDGFLDCLNASRILAELRAQLPGRAAARFRLPSETEWEYAARGGPRWRDGYRWSGSNDVDAVAWHERKGGDHTHEVARKAPNQLGIHDMSGNVWEWCQDSFTPDVGRIPGDGSAYLGPEAERVLRGGCFHNWAVHCTVSKRYEIAHEYHDGCIGFRLALDARQGDPSLARGGGGGVSVTR